MHKETAKTIILNYLENSIKTGKHTFRSHEFQHNVVEYGWQKFDKIYSPSTYNRQWRLIRSDKEYIDIGIKEIQKISNSKSKESEWKIIL